MAIIIRKPFEKGFYIESENRGTLGNKKKMKEAIKFAKEEAKRNPHELIFIVKPMKVIEKDTKFWKHQKGKNWRTLSDHI